MVGDVQGRVPRRDRDAHGGRGRARDPRRSTPASPASTCKDADLTAHLLSPDFFDAERFPELRFRAEDVGLDGDGITADGEITIKGVTKPVTVTGTVTPPIADPWGMQRLGITVTASVDRTDFGINWNNPLPTGDLALANEVTITAELQFVQAT